MKRLLKGFMVIILGIFLVFAGSWFFSATGANVPELDADQIYQSYSDSIFYIRVFKDGTLKTVGSGFLIGDEAALTAFHVVDGGSSYEAVFDDGKTVKNLKIQKTDKEMDLALISLKAGNRKGLNMKTSEAAHGQRVYALGYPMKGTKIITEGIINTPEAEINGKNRILTSAQVASGMSGGPLLDSYGNVVGLISGSLRNMSNIHICISAENIKGFIEGGR